MTEERRVEAEAAMERELTLQKEQLEFEQQVWTMYHVRGHTQVLRGDELKDNLSARSSEKERIDKQQIEMEADEEVNMAELESKVHEEYGRRAQELVP